MNALMKKIRKQLNVSQDQLAGVLGVSCKTIEEWEKEECIPNESIQYKLFDMCKSHKLDLTNFIIDQLVMSSDERVFYHASREGIKGNIQPISHRYCDFGKGFYMTPSLMESLKRVCNEKHPLLYTLSIDLSELKVLEVNTGFDWIMLLAYYCGYFEKIRGSTLYEKYAHMTDGYDVIVGFIVNDQVYQVLTDFFEEKITDEALIASVKALNLEKQYVAITEKACDQISILSKRELLPLELMIIKETCLVRRQDALRVTNQAIKKHRKDGLYFDEILRGERK